jgi:Protein of unknown function (DUF1552)
MRLLIVMDSFGVPPDRKAVWAESSVGDYALTDSSLGTILQPLKAYRPNLALMSGTKFDSIEVTHDVKLHRTASAHALVGSKPSSGINASARQQHGSVDVLIGGYLNREYGLRAPRVYPQLFLSDRNQSGETTYCYDPKGVQMRAIAGPTSIAKTVFGGLTDMSALQLDTRSQQAALELVAEQLKSIRPELVSASAPAVLDAYQASVSDLATQLELRSKLQCKAPDFTKIPKDDAASGETNPAIMSLIQQAFACDLVSVVTYAPGGEYYNNMSHDHLYNAAENNDSKLKAYLGQGLHGVSHKADASAHKTQELVRRGQAKLVADLLDKLKVTPELDGSGDTMFDNTVVWLTSAQSVYVHGFDNYVNAFIAGKNANIRTGYHYEIGQNTNNDIMTTLANGLHIPFEKVGGFGDGGKEFKELNHGPITKMLKA